MCDPQAPCLPTVGPAWGPGAPCQARVLLTGTEGGPARVTPGCPPAGPSRSGVRGPRRHPPVLRMVLEALQAGEQRRGTSVAAIKVFILQKYPTVDVLRLKYLLKQALATGMHRGLLVRPTNSKARGATGSFKVSLLGLGPGLREAPGGASVLPPPSWPPPAQRPSASCLLFVYLLCLLRGTSSSRKARAAPHPRPPQGLSAPLRPPSSPGRCVRWPGAISAVTFWVLGAHSPFLEFFTMDKGHPAMGSGWSLSGVFPTLTGSNPQASKPGLAPPWALTSFKGPGGEPSRHTQS